MSPEFDTSDPLGALMAEWRATATWFWLGLAIATVLTFVRVELAWLVAIAALGLPLIHLGHTVVIVGNELRKGMRPPQPSDEER